MKSLEQAVAGLILPLISPLAAQQIDWPNINDEPMRN